MYYPRNAKTRFLVGYTNDNKLHILSIKKFIQNITKVT